jgi:outer membrane protein assembly factor BamB
MGSSSGGYKAHKKKISYLCIVGLVLLTGLSACQAIENLVSGSNDPPLPGERISVLALNKVISPDALLASQPMELPNPQLQPEWPVAGGSPTRNLQHLAFSTDRPKLLWQSSFGNGDEDEQKLTAQPLFAFGRIFTLDSDGDVAAFTADNGNKLWSVSIAPPEEETPPLGGGLAIGNGRLYATAGFSEILCLDPANGGLIWKRSLPAPARSAPMVLEGRVYIITVDNQLLSFEALRGLKEWEHSGIVEATGLLGVASPAVTREAIIVPYSSGEIYSLRPRSGQVQWSDSLAAVRRQTAIGAISDIRGLPVIDERRLFAISNSGRMLALDVRTGNRLWEQEIGGINTPWLAGNVVFILSSDQELLALDSQTGGVRWLRQLARFEDPDNREDPISWYGPLLAGGRLLLASSDGHLLEVSPQNGAIIADNELPDGVGVAPIVANSTLYLLTLSGNLLAYR